MEKKPNTWQFGESLLFLFTWKNTESHPIRSEAFKEAKSAEVPLFIPVEMEWIPDEKILMLQCELYFSMA